MKLKIHFLNVGHGDCTLVELPSGRLAMIDINNSKTLPPADIDALAAARGLPAWAFKEARQGKRSWEDYYCSLLVDPVDYYRTHFDGQSIFRYVQTHPDMDHMSGLHRFFWQERIPLLNFWDVAHAKTQNEQDCDSCPYDYADWLTYKKLRRGIGPDKSEHKVVNNLRGATGQYWTDDDVEVLSPTAELIADCDCREEWNDCSYVLKISYAGRSILLPGDAESAAWDSMLDGLGPDALRADILKAAHHGRESGYHKESVNAIDPNVVICSVGKKPETDASDEYASHGASVLSTRFHGTITATVWHDGEVWIEDHNGERVETLSPWAA